MQIRAGLPEQRPSGGRPAPPCDHIAGGVSDGMQRQAGQDRAGAPGENSVNRRNREVVSQREREECQAMGDVYQGEKRLVTAIAMAGP